MMLPKMEHVTSKTRAKPRLTVRPTAALKAHPMWSQSDFEYLRGKGYSNREVLAFWDRDQAHGAGPVEWHPQNAKYLAWRSRIVKG